MKKLAVMLPNWVGDACMATPALRSLRQELPREVQIVWIGRPGALGVLEGLYAEGLHREISPDYDLREPYGFDGKKLNDGALWAEGSICYKPRSEVKSVLNRRRLVRLMRTAKFDTILYLTNSFSTALIGRLAGISRRIGYAQDWRSSLLTDRVSVRQGTSDSNQDPCIDNYMRLIRVLGCKSTDRRMVLRVSKFEQQLASECLASVGFALEHPYVLLNAGAATTQTKRWGVEPAGNAARRMSEQFNCDVLIHCGPAERDVANQIESIAATPRVRSMGTYNQLPLGLSRALIAQSRMVVSTDSGPRHIAVAFNKPVVSLFGSIDPKHTTTYNVPERIVTLGLACQPCGSYNCRFKHSECMTKLDSERVFRAASEVWSDGS
jgi:heptosyltransferase-2